ncbi:MAG: hypothetical protein AYK19_14275 [Theionarchaea archaeon DG-70-1]|nr:MAG: hypothetical protein AYK19_14275 [Theionarchaea archaeon DG-70-1]
MTFVQRRKRNQWPLGDQKRVQKVLKIEPTHILFVEPEVICTYCEKGGLLLNPSASFQICGGSWT